MAAVDPEMDNSRNDLKKEADSVNNAIEEAEEGKNCRLKLQVTGLETERRKDVLVEPSSTIKMLKEAHFNQELGDGCNIRMFHAGRVLRDHDTVEKLDGEFVHCFLSRLKTPPSSTGPPIAVAPGHPATGVWTSGTAVAPPPQIIMAPEADDLRQCAIGLHDNIIEWPTLTGLLCGFCFFPWGVIICLLHRQVRCRRCGIRIDMGV
eukprot:GEMP01036531.1.p1 GENE.GEMP01036531.1~~GEMP01036531.1.p1  ORF type:complete len:206 (-),score=34.91 GEMP01036531.1:1286-1903(-)